MEEQQFQTPPASPEPEISEQAPTQPPKEPVSEKKGGSKCITTVVIIILLLVAAVLGYYYYGIPAPIEEEPLSQQELDVIGEEIGGETDELAESLQEQGESDATEDIEKDLDLTDFEDLDKELGDIDSEFGF